MATATRERACIMHHASCSTTQQNSCSVTVAQLTTVVSLSDELAYWVVCDSAIGAIWRLLVGRPGRALSTSLEGFKGHGPPTAWQANSSSDSQPC